jgi:hypothetical protein
MVKDKIPNQGKRFQTESIIYTTGDDVRLDDTTGWIHEVTGETIVTWLGSELTPDRVLIQDC